MLNIHNTKCIRLLTWSYDLKITEIRHPKETFENSSRISTHMISSILTQIPRTKCRASNSRTILQKNIPNRKEKVSTNGIIMPKVYVIRVSISSTWYLNLRYYRHVIECFFAVTHSSWYFHLSFHSHYKFSIKVVHCRHIRTCM